MTIPNAQDGLSPNVDLAFATSADGSLAQQAELDQPTVEALLKDRVQQSTAWSEAHETVYDGLLGTAQQPFATRIILTVIYALTNLDLTNMNLFEILFAVAERIIQIPIDLIEGIAHWVDEVIFKPIISAITNGLGIDLGALGAWAANLLGFGSQIPAENLYGQVSSSLFGIIPVSHISNEQPNLITHGAFASSSTVDSGSIGWEWDGSQTYTGTGGSLKVVANGTIKQIYCNQEIRVAEGDKVAVTAFMKTSNFSGSGTPISLSIIPFKKTVQQTAITIDSAGSSPSWAQMYGNVYQVPNGVTSLRVRLAITSGASSGTIWFDDVRLAKTGLLQQNFVERLVDAWNNFWNGIFGGTETGKTVDDVYLAGAAVSGVANTASTNAQSALSQIIDMLWKLLNAPAQIIGSIINVVVDGIATMGQFLNDLWNGFTGQFAVDKKVDDVKTGAASVASAANTAASNATTALGKATAASDMTQSVLEAGSNLVKNSGFESGSFSQSGINGGYTDSDSRSGTKSLLIRRYVNTTNVFKINSTDTQLTKFPVSAGDVFFAEVYVKGRSQNTQTSGGENAIRMTFRPYDKSGTALATSALTATAHTNLSADWAQIAGYVTMPSGATSMAVELSLTADVTAGDGYFFDDLVIREVTLAKAADANANTAQSTANTANTNNANTQALLDAKVAGQKNLATNPDCSVAGLWKTATNCTPAITGDQFRSGAACVQLTIIGGAFYPTVDMVRSVVGGNAGTAAIIVQTGDVFRAEAWVRAKSGNAATKPMYIQFYATDSTGQTSVDSVNTTTVTPTTAGWTKISGTYVVPADKDRLTVRVGVNNNGSSGDVYYIDDLVLLETTDASAIADGINGSINGGSPSGSLPGSVGTNLNFAWSTFFDGLNGSTGSVNKLPADVKTAANTVRGTASNAFTNAGTAQTTANKAKSIIDNVASSANLVISPNFEDITVDRIPYYAPVVTLEYTTADKFQGTRSLKFTSTSASFSGVYLAPTETVTDYACRVGDTFEVKTRIKAAGGSMTAGAVKLYMRWVKTSDGTWTDVTATLNNTAIGSGWNELNRTYTCPDGYDALRVFVGCDSTTPVGNSYYLDAVSIREITAANTASSAAATADSKAVAADSKAVAADTKAGNAQTAANTAQSTADYADTIGRETGKSGSNMVIDPGFENSTVLRAFGGHTGSGYSTTVKRGGAQSFKLVCPGTSVEPYLYLDAGATGVYADTIYPCNEGDRFYIEAWVYAPSANNHTSATQFAQLNVRWIDTNTAAPLSNAYTTIETIYLNTFTKGAWRKISGTVTVPTATDPANRGQFNVYIQFGNDTQIIPLNNVYYIDDVVIREVTFGSYAQDSADAAQLTANDASDVATGALEMGANIVPDASFEKDFYFPTANGASISSDIARTGTKSVKIVGTGGTPYGLIVNNKTATYRVQAKANNVYQVTYYVYGKTAAMGRANTESVTNAVSLGIQWYDSSGTYLSGSTVRTNASTGLNGAWTKVSGYIVLPNTTSIASIRIYVQLVSVAADTYYFDDVEIIDVTEGYNAAADAATADGKAVTAQGAAATADGKAVNAQNAADAAQTTANTATELTRQAAASGSNIVINSGFENLNFYGNGSYSTEQKRTGARSLKLTSTAATLDHYVTVDNDSMIYFPVSDGDSFSIEFWVYGKSTNVGGGTVQCFVYAYTAAGVAVGGAYAQLNVTTAHRSVWTKVSAVATLPSNTGTSYANARIRLVSTVPANDVYYFDDVVIREVSAPTETNKAIEEAINGGTGTGTSAAAGTAITNLKNKITNGYTVESITSGSTWTKPTAWATGINAPTEFWVVCIGAGGGGGAGTNSVTIPTTSGAGGAGGGFAAARVNVASLPATVSYSIAAATAGRTATSGSGGTNTATSGGQTTFGTAGTDYYVTTLAGRAFIGSPVGYYTADDSQPGGGGTGGLVSANGSTGNAGVAGTATPLGTAGSAGTAGGSAGGAGGNGGAGGTAANSTSDYRAGGGGGGGGGASVYSSANPTADAGNGGNGGFPGGGGGGGGSIYNGTTSALAGSGGTGAAGAIYLVYK